MVGHGVMLSHHGLICQIQYRTLNLYTKSDSLVNIKVCIGVPTYMQSVSAWRHCLKK